MKGGPESVPVGPIAAQDEDIAGEHAKQEERGPAIPPTIDTIHVTNTVPAAAGNDGGEVEQAVAETQRMEDGAGPSIPIRTPLSPASDPGSPSASRINRELEKLMLFEAERKEYFQVNLGASALYW
jgi:hypothetical protein